MAALDHEARRHHARFRRREAQDEAPGVVDERDACAVGAHQAAHGLQRRPEHRVEIGRRVQRAGDFGHRPGLTLPHRRVLFTRLREIGGRSQLLGERVHLRHAGAEPLRAIATLHGPRDADERTDRGGDLPSEQESQGGGERGRHGGSGEHLPEAAAQRALDDGHRSGEDDGHVDGHEMPGATTVEEVGHDGPGLVSNARDDLGPPGRRQERTQRGARVHERAPRRVEEQEVRPSLRLHDAPAERVEGAEIRGVGILRLGERLEGGDGRLQLLVDGQRHRPRSLAHAALGDRELQRGVLADHERCEAQDGHQRGEHEDDEVASETHGLLGQSERIVRYRSHDGLHGLIDYRPQCIVAPRWEDHMSHVRRFMLAVLLGGVIAAASPALAQTTLTMSSWVSPQHHLTANVLQGWATEAAKATNGRVKFTMLPKHPSAPPGTFDAVRDGLVDLSFVTASYTPARHILPLLPELPGSGDTALVNSVAYSRIHWKYFQKVGEYKGVKLLGVFTHGPGQMFTKKPVATIGDVQGLKIRTGGGVAESVAKALGASAFVKPAPESYELLSSGVADGVFFPLESIISFKLDTVLEQATLFPGGMYSSSFGFV